MMVVAQLVLSALSFVALFGIALLTYRIEQRAVRDAARENLIRRLEDVYRALMELWDTFTRPIDPMIWSPGVVPSPPSPGSWTEILRTRDSTRGSLQVCLAAVPNASELLPTAASLVLGMDGDETPKQINRAMNEVHLLLIELSEPMARVGVLARRRGQNGRAEVAEPTLAESGDAPIGHSPDV